ncbi:MAG: hypothetical protein MI725_14645 [Pirellulales bacterium]|nr:hypothetical protein [Pirellulales bacterium]
MRVLFALYGSLVLACSAALADAPQSLPTLGQSLAMQKLESEFLQREMRAAYDQVGQRNVKWNEPARQLLDGWIQWKVSRFTAPTSADLLALAKQAVDAGCDDPMVRYCQGRLLRDENKNFAAAHVLRTAYDGFLKSEYDLSFRCWAAQHLADAIIAAGPDDDAKPYLQAKRELLPLVFSQANYQPHEMRLLLKHASHHYFEACSLEEAKANWRLLSNTKMEPWLSHCLQGRVILRQACEYRAGIRGLPNPEQRKKHNKYLEESRKHYAAAWELNNKIPETANWLMAIARMKLQPLSEVRYWFDQATALELDYYEPYTQLRYVMQKRHWGASHAQMVETGRTFLASGRFDTVVPFVMLQFVAPSIPKIDQPYRFFHAEGVYEDLVAMAEGYLAEPTMRWKSAIGGSVGHSGPFRHTSGTTTRCRGWRLADLQPASPRDWSH